MYTDRGKAYQCDPEMYTLVREEPEHEAALGWEHIGVLLRLLRLLLRLGELGSIVSRDGLFESAAVGWWIELRGFLEDIVFGRSAVGSGGCCTIKPRGGAPRYMSTDLRGSLGLKKVAVQQSQLISGYQGPLRK